MKYFQMHEFLYQLYTEPLYYIAHLFNMSVSHAHSWDHSLLCGIAENQTKHENTEKYRKMSTNMIWPLRYPKTLHKHKRGEMGGLMYCHIHFVFSPPYCIGLQRSSTMPKMASLAFVRHRRWSTQAIQILNGSSLILNFGCNSISRNC